MTGRRDEALRKQIAGVKLWTYKELEDLTDGSRLGAGGSADIFRGALADGTPVAIKRLRGSSPSSSHHHQHLGMQEQFWSELRVLGTFRHPNLLPVLGACTEDGQPLCLVYPYMQGRSLHARLHQRRPGEAPLTVPQRLTIAAGVATAVAYLHSRTHAPWVALVEAMADDRKPAIVHRDIKTDNILLDGDLRPRLADCGLARGLSGEDTHATMALAGSEGYLDPEPVSTGHFGERSDVYAFGVVLLELLTGEPARVRDANPPNLVARVWPWLMSTTPGAVASPEWPPVLALQIALLAHRCLRTRAVTAAGPGPPRPTAAELVGELVYLSGADAWRQYGGMGAVAAGGRGEAPQVSSEAIKLRLQQEASRHRLAGSPPSSPPAGANARGGVTGSGGSNGGSRAGSSLRGGQSPRGGSPPALALPGAGSASGGAGLASGAMPVPPVSPHGPLPPTPFAFRTPHGPPPPGAFFDPRWPSTPSAGQGGGASGAAFTGGAFTGGAYTPGRSKSQGGGQGGASSGHSSGSALGGSAHSASPHAPPQTPGSGHWPGSSPTPPSPTGGSSGGGVRRNTSSVIPSLAQSGGLGTQVMPSLAEDSEEALMADVRALIAQALQSSGTQSMTQSETLGMTPAMTPAPSMTQEAALASLSALAADSPVARRLIKLEGGVQAITKACVASTGNTRAAAASALRNLATSSESCAFLIVRGGLEGIHAVLSAHAGSTVAAKVAATATLVSLSEHPGLLGDVAASGVLGPLARQTALLVPPAADRWGAKIALVLSRAAAWAVGGGGPAVYTPPASHRDHGGAEGVIAQVIPPLVQSLLVGTESGAAVAERTLKLLARECPQGWRDAIGQRLAAMVRSAAAAAAGDDAECVETAALLRALLSFARDPACRELLTHADVAGPLVALLSHGCTDAEEGLAATALDSMLDSPGTLESALAAGVVPALLRMVETGHEAGFRAAEALAHVLRQRPGMHGEVLPRVSELLGAVEGAQQRRALRFLQALCMAAAEPSAALAPEHVAAFSAYGLTTRACALLLTGAPEIRREAARALRLLAHCGPAMAAAVGKTVVDSGAVSALLAAVGSPSSETGGGEVGRARAATALAELAAVGPGVRDAIASGFPVILGLIRDSSPRDSEGELLGPLAAILAAVAEPSPTHAESLRRAGAAELLSPLAGLGLGHAAATPHARGVKFHAAAAMAAIGEGGAKPESA